MGKTQNQQFQFLLADDDADDRYFFEKALQSVLPETSVAFAENGEKLMELLSLNLKSLPDVLFLDLNMPRKNGAECLREIRDIPSYDCIAIIIYSTSSHEDVADILYKNGAHYFVRKPDLTGLVKVLQYVVGLLLTKSTDRPVREKFVLKIK